MNRFVHSGVLVIDKPAGMSSAGVVGQVKRTLGAGKVGHAGTLDPMATGVLICCVNAATRLARFFLGSEKRYEAGLRLGLATDTQDATGQTVFQASDTALAAVSQERVREAFAAFSGPIEQQPPVYSALKHGGTPLYRLARRGKPVQKPPRRVHIRQLEILAMELPRVRFRVHCSAGTYIRTLAADIGQRLGCGGHLESLRRTGSGGFGLQQALALEQLRARMSADPTGRPVGFMDMTSALPPMPEYRADERLASHIAFGRPLNPQDLQIGGDPGPGPQFVKVVDAAGRLLAVLEHDRTSARFHYCCVFTSPRT